MRINPQQFEELLSAAVKWVAEQEAVVLEKGEALNKTELDYARRIGIVHPENVRLLKVPSFPMPTEPILKMAMESLEVQSSNIVGLTLRYAVFIKEDWWRQQNYQKPLEFVVHELVHTHQYERLGGIEPYLRQYLTERQTFNYPNNPLEVEAWQLATNILRKK